MQANLSIDSPAPFSFSAALPEHAWLTGSACAPYLTDVMQHSGAALAVALPESTAHLSELVRSAFAQGVRLIPQGERTGLVGAAVPDRSGKQCVVSLARMNRVRDFDPLNRSITVDAGMRLSDLNRHAAAAGLCLPLDLGSNPSVGGLIGSNAGGSRLLKYGDVRRNVLGLEAVLADRDGTVLDMLAPLRKNNTGLDLKQIFIGAGGAHGVVSAVSFALAPVERSTLAIFIAFHTYADAALALQHFEDTFGEMLSAYEFISASALARVRQTFPALSTPFDNTWAACFALVEIASAMTGLDTLFETRALEVLETLGHDGGVIDAALGASERFWRIRDSLPLAVVHDALPLSFDVSFARGTLVPFLEDTGRWLAAAHAPLQCYEFGHFGDGGCHLIIAIPHALAGAYGPMRQIGLRSELYERVRKFGGSFSAEHGIGPSNLAYYRKLVPEGVRTTARAIQGALDPAHLMGRFRY
jgi:FAD/FMN-containing dehydrogenase